MRTARLLSPGVQRTLVISNPPYCSDAGRCYTIHIEVQLSPEVKNMFVEQSQMKDADGRFQLELPIMEFIIDQACESFCDRVIRICDHSFAGVREQQA